MRQNCPPTTVIQQLADRGHGFVTRQRLLVLGATPGWIRQQMLLGWLIRVHAGVYAVGHVPLGAVPQAAAAVLACGERSALSRASAAALWGAGIWPQHPEVVAPTSRKRPGIVTHRSSTLTERDLRTHRRIRVTSPALTVLDLQPRLTDAALVRLVNDLRLAGHLPTREFQALCVRSVRIDALLGYGGETRRPTRSVFEDQLPAFARRHDLPMPELNAVLPGSGREVDALYRDARLIIELDSWRHHSDRAAFERDRVKDARALADGYRTLRITPSRLRRGGGEEADTIRRILHEAAG